MQLSCNLKSLCKGPFQFVMFGIVAVLLVMSDKDYGSFTGCLRNREGTAGGFVYEGFGAGRPLADTIAGMNSARAMEEEHFFVF